MSDNQSSMRNILTLLESVEQGKKTQSLNEGILENTGDRQFDSMMKTVTRTPTAKARNAERTRQKVERQEDSRRRAAAVFGTSPADKLGIRKSGMAEGSYLGKTVDMKHKTCTRCKKGTYQETGFHDDMDGVLHCTNPKCRKEVKRHQPIEAKKKVGVTEDADMLEETYHGDEFFESYGEMWFNEDEQLDEAEYQGRKVSLGKPMQGDVKKFKVYVKDPKTGNVKKVNFGDPNMKIRKSNPGARKSFRARHNCANPGPRTKARYWSCRKW
jgi:hypothetical protein